MFVSIFQGPSEGYICVPCFNTLDQEGRKILAEIRENSKHSSSTSAKRKEVCSSTPVKTPRIVKKLKTNLLLSPISSVSVQEASRPKNQARTRLSFSDSEHSTFAISDNITISPQQRSYVTQKKCWQTKVTKALFRGSYSSAFNHILSRGPKVEKAFDEFVKKRVEQQIKKFIKEGSYPVLSGTASLEKFSWADIITELTQYAPTFMAALLGSMPKKKRQDEKKMRYYYYILSTGNLNQL